MVGLPSNNNCTELFGIQEAESFFDLERLDSLSRWLDCTRRGFHIATAAYHFVIAVWRAKETECGASETLLGNYRRQSPQGRLEFGLGFSH